MSSGPATDDGIDPEENGTDWHRGAVNGSTEGTDRDSTSHDGPKDPPTSPPRQQMRSPLSSPNLSSSINIWHLGMMPLSPLRNQFSPPPPPPPPPPQPPHQAGPSSHPPASQTDRSGSGDGIDGADKTDGTSSSSDDDDDDELTQDSKDVLVDRLNDLIVRLARPTSTENVAALHARVDEMEHLLSARHARPASKKAAAASHSRTASRDEPFWGHATPPGWLLPPAASPPQPPQPTAGAEEAVPVPGPVASSLETVSTEAAGQLVKDAETLCMELDAVMASLKQRREESDHIHGLLITRAERAAQRIIELEARIKELEAEAHESEADFSFLRIQLKAIEAQCLEYMPDDTDADLFQSIANWKREFTKLKRNRLLKRENSSVEPSSLKENVTG